MARDLGPDDAGDEVAEVVLESHMGTTVGAPGEVQVSRLDRGLPQLEAAAQPHTYLTSARSATYGWRMPNTERGTAVSKIKLNNTHVLIAYSKPGDVEAAFWIEDDKGNGQKVTAKDALALTAMATRANV